MDTTVCTFVGVGQPFGAVMKIIIGVEVGGGWMLNRTNPEDAKVLIHKLTHYLDGAGRDRTSFGINVRVNLSKHARDTWVKLVANW